MVVRLIDDSRAFCSRMSALNTSSVRAFARARASASSFEGAFNQSRNQVRRLISGGPCYITGDRAHKIGRVAPKVPQSNSTSGSSADRSRKLPAGLLVAAADHVERRALAAGQPGDVCEHRAPDGASATLRRNEVREVHRAHSITVSVMPCQYRFGNLPVR